MSWWINFVDKIVGMYRKIGFVFLISFLVINAFAIYNYYDVFQCIKGGGRMCFTFFTLILSLLAPLSELLYDHVLFWLNIEFKFIAINAIILLLMNSVVIFVLYFVRKFR